MFVGTDGGAQSLTAGVALELAAGTGTATSTHVSSGGAQTVNALGIRVEGGASGGGSNNGNFALLQAAGNQSLTVGALGIDITGGGGALTDNRAFIWQSGGAGTNQTVTVSGGGGITLQGGSSAGSNVGGFGHGSFASLEGWGDSQTITLSAGAVSLTGGTNGSRALASIYAPNGSQSISGASSITLRGGDSGGIDGEGNGANIAANAGTQSISASSISLIGGLGGAENTANFFSGGNQTITASGLSLTGGPGGGGFDTGNAAFIHTNGSQSITVGAGGLQLTGGGGPLTDNAARILQLGTAGTSQTITVNGGGSITLVGGSSADVDVGGTGHGSRALIEGSGDAQNITFSIPGSGAINLTGGGAGSRAFAHISSVNGSQTITGPGAINITGGAAGGFAGEGNSAGITAALGLQSITAGTATLIGGASGIENSAFITAPTQLLDFGGNVSLAGSAGGDTNSGARIGGPGTTSNTNTTMDVTGNLTLAAGANSGVAIGSSGNGTGLTNTINVTVSGDVVLTPSATQGVRIGSPAADIQTGAISVAAGGNILFNGSGSTGRASMRSLGNVALSAGSSVTQSSEAVVTANQLSTSSGGNTSLAGANQVNTFSASSTAGNIGFTNAQSLSVGSVSTGAGAQTVAITSTGGASNLALGASTTDDNWNLVSGGALSLTGALSGNNLSLTSGAALTLGQNLTAAGSLDLVTPNGNAITQVAGTITVGGLTTINAGAGDVTLTSTGNDFNQIGVTSGGTVRLRDANAVVLNNTNVSGLVLQNAGDIVLDGTITATAVGDAVALASTAGILDSGTGTISTPNGRWLVYLATPVGSDLSGLSADFRQYNAVLGSAILGSGDGLLFGLAPTITAALSGGPSSKVYDASTSIDVSSPSILASAVGVQVGDTVTLSKVGGGVLDDKNVGSNKNVSLGVQIASATGAGGIPIFGYTFLSTGTTSGTASGAVGNVTAASLAASGLVANNKVYDATTVATLGGAGSVVGLGSDSVSLAGTAVGSFADKNVGTAKVVSVVGLTLAGPDAGNYTLVPPSGLTADISVASLAVTGLSANNKTYDATTAATLAGIAGVAALGSDTLVLGGTPSATFADKNVGNAKPVSVSGFTLGGSDAANYSLAQPAGLSANITPASISSISGITAANKVYDATTAATLNTGAVGFVGMLGTDNLTLAGASGAFSDKNVGSPKTVTITGLTLGGADAGNYTLASATATTTASITAASIGSVGGITANNKVYDGTTVAGLNTAGASFVGILGSDSLSVSGATGAFANKNAGSAKTVNISGISLGGADAANYVLANSTASTTADISQANLSVTGGITAANRVYDGTTSASLNASGATFSGVLGSDNVIGLGASGNFADKNAGPAKPVAVSSVSLGGTDGANYLVSSVSVTPSADITPAVISAVTGISASKTYDGSTSITLSDASASFAGMVPGDNLLASGVGSFADKKVDTGKALTVSALNLGGTDAGNYTLAVSSGSGTVTIVPKDVATWVGGGSNQLWSNHLNWNIGSDPGAIPDGANVLAVSIPADAGTIDMDVAKVTLQGLSSASPVKQSSGSLSSSALSLNTSAGIELASPANQIRALSASNIGAGDIVLANGGPDGVALELKTVSNTLGNIRITNKGAITTTGLVSAPAGTVDITANSPLTIGSAGVKAGGNITLVASNLTSAGNLVLNGDVRSALGSVKLDAGNNLEQYGEVFGALGVTADAGVGRTFGPLATSNNAPVVYRVNGVTVDPPPTSLGASTPVLQETAKQVDVLVTFLDLFEKAVESQQTEETNPDGTRKKKDSEAIVTEGEVCK